LAEKAAVLVMAYGTPQRLEDVEAYYTDIRRGRPPPPELLKELTERYRAIGGSPLLDITRAQARGLQDRLGIDCRVGQKHAPPFIADAVRAIAAGDVERVAGLVLAPHYSKMGVGDYESRARRAAGAIGWTGRLEVIPSWHLEPGYIAWLARAVEDALSELSVPARERGVVIFSAHSLPARILQAGDPYATQLRETAEAVAAEARLEHFVTGWQSAGRTKDPWLGPDVLELVEKLAGDGVPGIVVCACGFVADHLEVLYDLDIEAARLAASLGTEFARTAMPNDDPEFLDALAGVVGRALE
jgi:protoporphyrin/coproporphyrin ferrochelatase